MVCCTSAENLTHYRQNFLQLPVMKYYVSPETIPSFQIHQVPLTVSPKKQVVITLGLIINCT